MPLIIDQAQVEARSRRVLISLCSFILRFMENGRELIFRLTGIRPDYEVTMIITAVIAIRAEKLLRVDLPQDVEGLHVPIDQCLLSGCNVSSIAEAAGLNRETVRRRVQELSEQKILTREADGSVRIAPGLLELPEVRAMLPTQVASLVRTVNQLAASDVVRELNNERWVVSEL